jgi:hypothetical protein
MICRIPLASRLHPSIFGGIMSPSIARLFVVVMLGACLLDAAVAEDKDGLRVSVVKKTIDRNDARPSTYREIDRLMGLNLTMRNISMKDMPAGSLTYTILVRRWAIDEAGKIERFTGTREVPELKPAVETSMPIGEFRIGGHMHGTSARHVDSMVGWKVVVTTGDKKREFASTSNFDSMERAALAESGQKP